MTNTPNLHLSRRKAVARVRKRAKKFNRARKIAREVAQERSLMRTRALGYSRGMRFAAHLARVFGVNFYGVHWPRKYKWNSQWCANSVPGFPDILLFVLSRGANVPLEFRMEYAPTGIPELVVVDYAIGCRDSREDVIAAQWLSYMARGLYKLGQYKHLQALEAEFGPILSLHDKVECQQQLARDLWPPQWLDGTEEIYSVRWVY